MSTPAPSSVTAKLSARSVTARRTVAFVAPAYLATFCNASRVQKYTSTNTSAGADTIPRMTPGTRHKGRLAGMVTKVPLQPGPPAE